MTASTGPKISSRAMRMSFVALAKTVGCTYQPRSMPVGRPLPPTVTLRALFLAERDVLLDALLLALRDERTDLGRGVGRVADREAADHRRDRVDDLVVTAPAGEDAGLRDARLAVVHERRHLQALDRGREVGVVEDDRRRLAAELEAHALQLLAADGRDAPARRGRTGERDLVDAGVAHEVLADLATRGQDRDDALRDAGLVEEVGHEVRVERRLRRGLQDDRATRRAAPGASLAIVTNCGTFHGTMPATTPTGS